MNKIAVILVNYNDKKYIRTCLDSILAQDHENYFVVVVDNASTDGSLAIIEEYDEITILRQEENVGWAAGNNIGIRYALEHGADYVLLLNTDTWISPDLMTVLLSATDDNSVAAPLMYKGDITEEDLSVERFDKWYAGGSVMANGHVNSCAYVDSQSPVEVDFITGCCMLISKKVIEEVGYIDEDYFLYYEDVDYSMRVRKNGMKLIYNPGTYLIHCVGGSQGGEVNPISMYYLLRNRLLLLGRWFPEVDFTMVLRGCFDGIDTEIYGEYFIQALYDYTHDKLGQQNLDRE